MLTSLFRRRLLLAGLSLFALGAQAQTALDGIVKSKTIKIAVPTDYPPYGFVGPDMAPQGLDVAVAQLIAAKLGVKAELVPVTSANRIPYLQTKKADLVISTLGKNPEREKVINFSAAYAPFYQAVFAAKSLPIKSWADLARKKRRRDARRDGRPGAGQGRARRRWNTSASRTTTPPSPPSPPARPSCWRPAPRWPAT